MSSRFVTNHLPISYAVIVGINIYTHIHIFIILESKKIYPWIKIKKNSDTAQLLWQMNMAMQHPHQTIADGNLLHLCVVQKKSTANMLGTPKIGKTYQTNAVVPHV